MDQALQQLAAYDVTGGMIATPDSMEEAIELQLRIASRFNYFKKLIQNGSCTFEFIKNTVLDKNGPFAQPHFDMDDPECFDKLLERESEFLDEPRDKNYDEVSDTLNQLEGALMYLMGRASPNELSDALRDSEPNDPWSIPDSKIIDEEDDEDKAQSESDS
jgi:hypothetical protein